MPNGEDAFIQAIGGSTTTVGLHRQAGLEVPNIEQLVVKVEPNDLAFETFGGGRRHVGLTFIPEDPTSKPELGSCDFDPHDCLFNSGTHFMEPGLSQTTDQQGAAPADKRKRVRARVECPLCHLLFKDGSSMNIHKRTHTGERPFDCERCDKSFTSKNVLKVHMRVHSGEKPFGCDFCGRAFSHRSTLSRHVRSHTGERPFCCTLCPAGFKENTRLLAHLRTHTGERPFACEVCRKGFRTQSVKNCHVRTVHSEARPFACDQCEKRYKEVSGLKKHKLWHDGVKRAKMATHPCGVCERRFSSAKSLRSHVRTHTGEKPYACSECGKAFAERHGLKKHIQLLHGTSISCKHCLKLFKDKSSLIEHSKYVAGGAKPDDGLFCRICLRMFVDLSELEAHKASAVGEKKSCDDLMSDRLAKAARKSDDEANESSSPRKGLPYECQVCKIEFHRKSSWLAHRGSEHRDKTLVAAFQCCCCETSFVARETFNRHMAGQHGPGKE